MTISNAPPARAPRLARRRRSLLLGCAAGAAALMIAQPERATAQAFLGTIDGTSGSVTRTPTGPGSEVITIGSPTAIIDWSPDYGVPPTSFDFLPSSHSATFEGAANFAVLNRIGGPARIELNGTVISQLQGSPGTRSGTILFQTPGGFVIGPTAVFNVGNLVMTTLQVTTTGEGGPGPYFNPSSLSFSGASNPFSRIVTAPGSQINATAEGSYIAMVAPRIEHGGTVTVNGSAAYVAAEAATITINQGLFDIAVGSGTSDGQGVIHTGTTTGPASTGGGDNHGIYMVAVPKNQSIVALLRGSAGYTPAASASFDNGTIVLAAGYNVAGGAPAGRAGGTGAGFWLVQNGSHSSDVTGRASTAFEFSDELGPISFSRDVSVRGDGFVNFLAETGSTISVGRNLTLSTTNDRSALSDGSGASAGPIAFFSVTGSTISVGGDVLLDARAIGAAGSGPNPGGNAIGGDAFINADGGQVLIGGTLRIDTSATGGAGTIAGSGVGGDAGIFASGGSDVIASAATILADGTGGSGAGSDGGDGTGGIVNLVATGAGSTINLASLVGRGISATGYGGANEGGGAGVAGTGTGGSLFISASTGGAISLVNLSGSLSNTWARGYGGSPTADGSTGGFSQGGTITFQAVGAGSSLSGAGLNISANGFGRFPNNGNNQSIPVGNNVTGGDAAGGTTNVRANNGGTVFLSNGTIARATGIGGNGTGAGNGGSGTGGQLNVEVDGGAMIMQVFSAAGISFGASGGGGDGAIGGNGSQGLISLRVANGGLLQANNPNADPSDTALLFFVQGVGGAGDIQGGTGQAGTIEIDIDTLSTGSTIDVGVGAARFAANGIGGGVRAGSAGVGGAGIGGEIDLVTGVSNDVWTFNSLVVDVTGTGGASVNATAGASGGAGTGGNARIETPTGQLSAPLALTVNATGTGGAGFGSGTGGLGTGGLAEIINSGGTLTAGSTQVLAGGDGAGGGTGGNGFGGTARITSVGGQSTFGAAEIDSEAVGGAGAAGAGGTGTAGTATLLVSAGTVQFAELEVDANADGGDGATSGGGAVAGPALVNLTGGSLAVSTTLTIEADGEGGAGSSGGGGLGDGGDSILTVNGGSLTAGGFEATSRGLGGAATTDGGDGFGGRAALTVNAGSAVDINGSAVFLAPGVGGNGQNGGDGFAGEAGMSAVNGAIDFITAIARAEGTGGSALVGFGGTGGRGDGGFAYISAEIIGTASGIITGGAATVETSGFGGRGGNGDGAGIAPGAGGVGRGGEFNGTIGSGGAFAVAQRDRGTLTLGTTIVRSLGIGGDGGAGGAGQAGGAGGLGDGGTAQGGLVTLTGNGTVGQGRATYASLELDVSATGGAGGSGAPAGGTGGTGLGGEAFLISRSGEVVVGTAAVTANGRGGLSTGGTGGQGTGGLAEIVVEAAGDLNFTNAAVTASGIGGAGTTGGIGTGGTNTAPANANANAGAFAFVNDGGRLIGSSLTLAANGTGGAGASGGVGGAGLGGWAYAIAFNGAARTLVDVDTMNISADGEGGFGSTGANGAGSAGGNATGGLIGAYAESLNGEMRVDALVASADALGGRGGFGASGGTGGRGGDALGGTTTGIGTVSGAGSGTPSGLTIFGTVDVSASATGGAGGAAGGGATPGAGGAGGNATGGIRAGLLARGGTLTVTDAEFHADAVGGAGGAAGGVGAAAGRGGDATGGSAGALLTVRNQTTDPATVTVGSFVATSTAQAGAGGSNGATFFGLTNIDIDRSSATFGSVDLAVTGAAPSPSVGPTLVRVVGGTLAVTSAAGLEIDTTGNVLFDLIGSGIVNAQALDSNAGGTTTVQHSGRIGAANTIGGGTLSFTSNGIFTAAAGTRLGASSSISVSTNADAVLAGLIFAPTISIRSADIDLTSTGQVGDADNPGAVNLIVAPSGQQTVVGGAVEGPGYTLTQAEVERIEASSVSLTVPKVSTTPNRIPDVLVQDLVIAGSEIDGPASVTLQTDGIARIAGAVEYRGAAATDSLTISATERLDVITPDGSITILDSDEELSGQLTLTSATVIVASSGLAAQLAADPTLPGRGAALRTNDGPVNEAGYIQAGTIRFGSVGKVFVQNTGTSDSFSGLTVGSSSTGAPTLIFELAGGGSIPDIIAFGRSENADGSFTSGEALFENVDFRIAQGATYDESSQFNGCSINTGCIPPLPLQLTNASVVVGAIEPSGAATAAEESESETAQSFGNSFVGLVDTGSLSAEELIDEAVTSGGDSSLWEDECDPEDPLCEVREDRPVP